MDKRITEIKQLFTDYLIEKEEAELKTCEFLHDIYRKNILPLKNDICFSSALIVILCNLSRPLNWFKINILLTQEANCPHIPINIYGINILKSGGGKGISSNIMESILDLKHHQFNYIKNLSIDKKISDELNKIAKAEHQVTATVAGIRTMYRRLNDCFSEVGISNTFGSVFYDIGEFADCLENASSYDKEFFSILKDAYDLGKIPARVTKDDIKESIDNFGMSLLAATTDKTLQGEPVISREFNKFLVSGYARRSLLAIPSLEEEKRIKKESEDNTFSSLREWHEKTRYHKSNQINEIQMSLYSAINIFANRKKEGKTEILLDEETYFYYRSYKLYCEKKAESIKNPTLNVEMINRGWKALKLSALLLLYQNPSADTLTVNHFLDGVKIVEYYGHHLKRYLNNSVTVCSDKIVELLFDSKKAITKKDLMTNNEILSYNSSKITPGKFIDQQINDVEETLSSMGYELVIEKRGYKNKTTVYAAIKKGEFSNYKISEETPYTIIDNKPQLNNAKDDLNEL